MARHMNRDIANQYHRDMTAYRMLLMSKDDWLLSSLKFSLSCTVVRFYFLLRPVLRDAGLVLVCDSVWIVLKRNEPAGRYDAGGIWCFLFYNEYGDCRNK